VSQINVNNPPPDPGDGGGRAAAAGLNLVTVLIVLLVVVAILAFLFWGPLQGMLGGGTTNINVTVPTVAPSPKPGG
jgi:hypothetical protein